MDLRTTDWEKRVDMLSSGAIMKAYNSGGLWVSEEIHKARTVVWLTQEDERVCEEICGPMDGVQFDIHEAEDLLPAHPLCRCCWISLTEYEE